MGVRGRAIRCQNATSWHDLYGTTSSGNLPQYKKLYHVGHSWKPCPYSHQAAEDAYDSNTPEGTQDISTLNIRNLLGIDTTLETNAITGRQEYDSNYNTYFDDPLPANDGIANLENDHRDINGKIYYMKTQNNGSVWGFECTFDGCPYYIATGRRYFHS